MDKNFKSLDAYAAVRTMDGEILTDASKFADPDLAPVVVAKYNFESETQVHQKTAIYHSDLEKVEIMGDPNLYGPDTAQWAVVMDVISHYSKKLNDGPLPKGLDWSMEAAQDLKAVHNIDSAKALSIIMAESMVQEIDEFVDTAKMAKSISRPEVKIQLQSMQIGQLRSQVRR